MLTTLARRLLFTFARPVHKRVEGSRLLAPLLMRPSFQRLEAQLRVFLPAEEVVAVVGLLEGGGVRAWVMGGWGVDALMGRETRPHADLDALVAQEDEQRALALLERRGYRVVERVLIDNLPPLRTAVVLLDGARHRLELQPIDTGRLEALVAAAPAGGSPFATGTVGGRTVPCLSAAGQEFFHTGYPQRPRDHADMGHLRSADDEDSPEPVAPSGFRGRVVPAAVRRSRAAVGLGPSALNIHVPELEAVLAAPHITLVNPWMPTGRIAQADVDELGRLVGSFPEITFTLARTGRFPGILYLAPEPSAPIVALIEAIVARWPEHQPYGGAFDTIIPHLTVAFGAGVLEVPDAVAELLPLTVRVSRVDLMTMGRTGRWTMRASLPLRS